MHGFVVIGPFLAGIMSTKPSVADEVTANFVRASTSDFSRPHGLALGPDGRYLFVSDLGNDAIKLLDPDSLVLLGTIGGDDLSSPHDVTFDSHGHLLVADTGNDRIAIYEMTETDGRLVGELTAGLSSPEGVAVGPKGLIHVTNAGGHDLVVFEGGEAVGRAGWRGEAPGEYVRPHDIHVDGTGRVYVADPGINRLQILTPGLDPVTSLDKDRFRFHEPRYLDIDARDWLFVADEYNHAIKVLNPDRQLVATVGQGRSGKGVDLFNYPEGVQVLDDRMWVSDTRNHRIVLYRLTGIE